MLSDAIIRLEDPSQNPLTPNTDGNAIYSGTEATLSQVLLHEIGHALGLADNSDPHSIMYYQATAGNRTLDATDLSGIQALYNSAAQQMIQAMASFGAQPYVATASAEETIAAFAPAIAAPQYAH